MCVCDLLHMVFFTDTRKCKQKMNTVLPIVFMHAQLSTIACRSYNDEEISSCVLLLSMTCSVHDWMRSYKIITTLCNDIFAHDQCRRKRSKCKENNKEMQQCRGKNTSENGTGMQRTKVSGWKDASLKERFNQRIKR